VTYLDDLKACVSINSYTKNKSGVDVVGQMFDTWLKPLGFSVNVHQRELIGEHRHYKSKHIGGQKLLLLGHLDTVFPPNKFEAFTEDDEWVYGPGVCDMKGGNIVALQALRNVVTSHSIENIDILFVSDEETGSDDSKYLTQELASEYDYCFVYEAAGVDMEVVTARKGVGTFTIDIVGVAKHAGNHYADGVDANLEASYKLQKLVALTNLELGTTVNVGKIEGGIGANTISPHASLLFELRYTNADERDRVLKEVETIVSTSFVKGTTSTLSGSIQRDVMQESDNSLHLIKDIERITALTCQYESRGGVSDANVVSAVGVTTLDGFGPFGDGDHTVHERALKSSFASRIEMSEKLFRHFITHKTFSGE